MTKQIILAGGGHAHLAVLADWAMRPFPGTRRVLVTEARHTAYSGMLPGWMAGLYRQRDLLIDLAPLAQQAGAELVLAEVTGLDPATRQLRLSTAEALPFDLLSLATGGESDLSDLNELGDRLLPVRPVGNFMARWSAMVEAAAERADFRTVVVGGGAGGVELALGAAAALRGKHVTLVTPESGFLTGHAPAVRRLALTELRRKGIAIRYARATGETGGLRLDDGDFLPADCVIAATGSRAPYWLAASGLACTPQGFVSVGADLRSTSHPAILAAGDIIERADRKLERSGVHAVKAGPVLAANLRAMMAGTPLRHYQPRRRTLYLLALGDRRAIVSWGRFAALGRWAWRLKDQIDQGFVHRYMRGKGPHA